MRAPADRRAGKVERVKAVEESAHDALVRGAGELVARHVGAQTDERARRVGTVGRSLAIEPGKEREPTGTRWRVQSEPIETIVIDTDEARDGIGHLRRVERAHEREEAAGRVREPGDCAGRVSSGPIADDVRGARGPE